MTQNSNRILSILEHVDKIPEGGLEPPPLKRQEPKPCASTNSATLAFYFLIKKYIKNPTSMKKYKGIAITI